MTTTRVKIEVHLDRGGRDYVDRRGNVWPVSECGLVLQRLHARSSSLLDINCKGCITADSSRPVARLPYKE